MLPKFTEILCAGLMLCKAGTLCALEPTQTGMPAGQMHAQTRALLATKKTNFQAPTALAQERTKSLAALNPKRVSIPHFGWIGAAPGAIRIYRRRPTDRVARRSALFLHGGGFTFGSTAASAPLIGALSDGLSSCIYSFDYPLAPEHRFPAALDQAMAVWRYLSALPAAGGCPALDSIIGESAGGNLAMHISLRARDEGVQLPVYQLLVYPGINLLGAKVQGLPPTTIIAAEIDPLRSEGEQLAELLKRAGVPVERRQWDGVTHEFFGMAAVVPEAKEAVQFAGQRLRSAFGR